MTAWTYDVIVATVAEDPQERLPVADIPVDPSPYQELVADALVEDVQLDLVEWLM